MKKRIAEFRRTLEENEVLDTFDRYVFESIVEKAVSYTHLDVYKRQPL